MSYEDSIYGNSQTNQVLEPVLSTSGNVGPSLRIATDHDEELGPREAKPKPSRETNIGVRTKTPHLHFNGLAGTQTQSDRLDALARQGSLKENPTDPDDDFPGLKYTPSSILHQSQSRGSEETESQNGWQYRSRAVTPREDTLDDLTHNVFSVSNAANVSQEMGQVAFDSLPAPRYGTTSGASRAHSLFPSPQPGSLRRSSSGTQDSITGDLPYDIKKKLMVQSSKDLDPPLAESQESIGLLKDESQPSAYRGDNYQPRHEPQESQGSMADAEDESQPSAYRATGIEPPQPPSPVETEAPQEYSQRMPGSGSPSKQYSVEQMEQFYPGSEGHTQDAESSQDTAALEATQSTQPDSTQDANDGGKSVATTTTIAPRSILGLVDPRKAWRFKRHGQSPPLITRPLPSPPPAFSPEIPYPNDINDESQSTTSNPEAVQTQPWEETQPSGAVSFQPREDSQGTTSEPEVVETQVLLEETQPSDAVSFKPIGTLLGGHAQPAPESSPEPTWLGRRPRRQFFKAIPRLDSSDMDIVPDSEATQQAGSAASPSPEIPLPPARAFPPPRAKVPSPRQSSLDEVIPDSYEAEVDQDDSDEVPLAAMVKPKHDREHVDTDDGATTRETTPVPGPSKKKGKTASSRKAQGKQREPPPSSNPRDGEPSSHKKTRESAKGKRKVTPTNLTNIITPSRTRSLRSSTSKRRPTYFESSDEDEATTDRGPTGSFSNDELTDDDQMEVDEAPAPPSRKRKRGVSTASRKGKSSSKSAKGVSETPEPRAAKRRKSGSMLPSLGVISTRVFALWKQTNSFYSGTVRAADQVPGRYLVHFDDGDKGDADITKLRKYLLRPGDDVLWSSNQQAVVVDVEEDLVTIELDDAAKTHKEVPVKELRIASRTVNKDWEDRKFTAEEILSPEGSTAPASSAGGQIFRKTAFVLTFAPNCNDVTTVKDSLGSSISTQGGTVVEDWTSLFTLEGTHFPGGKKWKINKEDVGLSDKGKEFKRVLLLSNETSTKPRFLIALALGIPCVNVQWLHDSIEANKELEWHQYLLPAGTSETLSGRFSQLIDLDWGNSPHDLRDIMDNLVAAKPFAGMSVLCLSTEFVPQKNKYDAAPQMIPRIVLCMGAAHVEAVSDSKLVKLSKFDLVVLKDGEERRRHTLKGAKCVCMSWVKECLVTSRLLPLPFE